MTHDPMKSAAADAAATAAAYSARNTYALGWEAGARASRLEEGTEYQHLQETLDAAESRIAVEASRADVAEQRVCELRNAGAEAIREAHMRGISDGHPLTARQEGVADIIADFVGSDSSTADIAGRWVSMTDFERSGAKALVAMAQRDAAIARAEKAEARLGHVMMVHQQAERARDEVGIQYAAAQAVIASWSPVIRASQALCGVGGTDKHSRCFERLCAAVAALDTVPGDALTHPTRHLEALGIDTDNVKEKA